MDKMWSRLTKKDQCFIVAEIGSNHNGDLDLAKKMIDIASEAGADAVKFQFFLAEKIAADTKNPIAIMKKGVSLQQFYKTLETPRNWIPQLAEYCKKKKIIFFATPFDSKAVDLLKRVNVPLYKIASFELVDIPLIKKVARTGKPIILSTGMADIEEIKEAVIAAYSQNNYNIVLLHCGSNYPTPFEDVNLRAMATIRDRFKLPVGYSDHTLGFTVPVAAVALGAYVIEKHMTLDKQMEGADHGFALEPSEFKQMVIAIRECEQSLGSSEKKCPDSEKIHYVRGRRSIFAARDINEGQILTADDFAVLRPGIGLKPKYLDGLIGKKARKSIAKDEPVTTGIIKTKRGFVI